MCELIFKISHRPDGKNADALALILACTTAADALINYSKYVPQRPSKVPIAPMGKCLTPMGFSHASCFVLSGWRCLCLWRHGDLLIVHHHWQHSWLCACSSSKLPWDASLCSKVPIAPMGKMLTRLPRVSLAQLRTLPSTTGGACRRDLKSSHRPDGKMPC